MGKSIKKNYVLNLVNTVLGIVFPLITFPYSSRILMADGIGQVQFFNSIISYITLFTSIGIPTYAIRETARVRDDLRKLTTTTAEILILHTILSFIGYVAVGVICLTVFKVQSNIPLFLLLSLSILLSSIGVNWFYQGIEDFKYITIRNIIVKIVTIILLFLLVRDKSDLLWYAAILVIGSAGSNIFNFFKLRKHILFRELNIKELNPLIHLSPALKIWVLNLIISIYTQLDIIMLGFMKESADVGYFTAAHNLSNVLLYLSISLGAVMLPRLSNLITAGNMEEFSRLSQKAVDFIMTLSMPITFGLVVMAPTLIHLFCGLNYEPSILCLQLQAPIVLIIALSNIMGMQILYPQGKEKIVTIATGVGAIVNLLLNIILIPIFSQNGAAFSTVMAELSVTVVMYVIGKKNIPAVFINKRFFVLLSTCFVMTVVCALLMHVLGNDLLRVVIVPIAGIVIFSIIMLITKDPVVNEIVGMLAKSRNKS